MEYIPNYTVSGKAMNLIAEIAAAVERYRMIMDGPDGVRLRKINRIRTIRGTTAIEGNTLTEEEITDLLAGRRIKGTKREIDEIKAAHCAYDVIESLNPYSSDDLLKAHGLMTAGLIECPGKWRNVNVGVMSSDGKISHIAPPWQNVPGLMANLFGWLSVCEDPVLVKSCVFHYEFEFIHPFPDGNGRMGRLWQTALLGSWRKEFYAAPVENIVWAHQQEYYDAIRKSSSGLGCGPFIDFMLDMILRTLKAKGEAYGIGNEHENKSRVKSRDKSRDKVLCLLRKQPDLTQVKLADAMGLTVKAIEKIIRQLRDANLLKREGGRKFGRWIVS